MQADVAVVAEAKGTPRRTGRDAHHPLSHRNVDEEESEDAAGVVLWDRMRRAGFFGVKHDEFGAIGKWLQPGR